MTTATVHCDDCEALAINGVGTHELGCRSSWIDPATGDGYPTPCWECGCDFIPSEQRDGTCADCLED